MPPKQASHYSIQEVIERLRPQFTVTASNLRYWEKVGLLTPARTEGGHRLYSDDDIERIALIKTLQTKRFFSLDAIRRYCQSGLSNEEIAGHLESNAWVFRPLTYDQSFTPLRQDELAELAGLSHGEVQALVDAGLLPCYNEGDSVPLYDEDAARMAELLGEFVDLGLTPEQLQPLVPACRELATVHLRRFLDGLLGDGGLDAARLGEVLPHSEEYVRLLYHKAVLQVARQLASSGYFQQRQPSPEVPDGP